MKLKDYSINVNIIPDGKIIAYDLKSYLTLSEYNKLPVKTKEKFKPIHEKYDIKYIQLVK